jgi:hypothetical protein
MEAIDLFDELERRFGKDQVVVGNGYVSEATRSRAATRARLSGQ